MFENIFILAFYYLIIQVLSFRLQINFPQNFESIFPLSSSLSLRLLLCLMSFWFLQCCKRSVFYFFFSRSSWDFFFFVLAILQFSNNLLGYVMSLFQFGDTCLSGLRNFLYYFFGNFFLCVLYFSPFFHLLELIAHCNF